MAPTPEALAQIDKAFVTIKELVDSAKASLALERYGEVELVLELIRESARCASDELTIEGGWPTRRG